MIILNSRNIYYHIKKNDYLIKFYSHFLDLFKIIKIKFRKFNIYQNIQQNAEFNFDNFSKIFGRYEYLP